MNSNAIFDPTGEKLELYSKALFADELYSYGNIDAVETITGKNIVATETVTAPAVIAKAFLTEDERIYVNSGITPAVGSGLSNFAKVNYTVKLKTIKDAQTNSDVLSVKIEGWFTAKFNGLNAAIFDVVIPSISTAVTDLKIVGQNGNCIFPNSFYYGLAHETSGAELISQSNLQLTYAGFPGLSPVEDCAFYFNILLTN